MSYTMYKGRGNCPGGKMSGGNMSRECPDPQHFGSTQLQYVSQDGNHSAMVLDVSARVLCHARIN